MDAVARFELILFDYSGQAKRPTSLPEGWPDHWQWLSVATACKGDILRVLYRHLQYRINDYKNIGLIDDDVAISIAQINETLTVARHIGSACFSPSLAVDPDGFVPHMVSHQPVGPSRGREVDWVDLKMSFIRADLFQATAPFYSLDYSGYGIARFVHPYFARVLRITGGFHVFDEIIVHDCRPHRSGLMTFPNGFTGLQEAQRLHRVCLTHLIRERPDLLNDLHVRRILALPLVQH